METFAAQHSNETFIRRVEMKQINYMLQEVKKKKKKGLKIFWIWSPNKTKWIT